MARGFYIFLLVLVMMLLFAFGFKLFSRMTRKPLKKKLKHAGAGKAGNPGACPVCGIVLESGQKIQSAVFPGGNDRICHIFGCSSCLSPDALSARRTCPVCKKELKREEYLIARFFEHPGRKNHVHILGCVHCRMG